MTRSGPARQDVDPVRPSRVELVAEGVIEAGWLVALAIIPLFVNVYSIRSYEADKIALFRTIVVVMVAAWSWKVLSGGRSHAPIALAGGSRKSPWAAVKQFLSLPLVGAVVALAISVVVSALLSVDPRVSWLGNYDRFAGAWTHLAYIVFFGLVAGHLRTATQWRRASFVIVLTGSTVALYAILQALDLDPRWIPRFGSRVYSTLGNPIFLAGYLAMTVFVTGLVFGNLISERRRHVLADPIRRAITTRVVIVGLALVGQLLAILLSESRGPVVGLAAGGYVVLLAAAARVRATSSDAGDRRKSRLATSAWYGGVAMVAAGLALIIVVSIPGSPLSSLRDVPYAGRIVNVLDFESGSSQVRLNIWRAIVDLFGSDEAIQAPDEPPDRLDAWRPLIGYGPETLKLVTYSHLPAGLEVINEAPDRAHNETFDVLASQGGLGYAAWFALYGGVFVLCLGGIGLLGSRRKRDVAWLGLGVGAAGGVLIPRLVTGEWALAGVGLATGMIVWLAVLVAARTAPRFDLGGVLPAFGPSFWLTLTVLATLIAHFVEVHFGIAVVATRVHFWFLAAALVAMRLGAPVAGIEPAVDPEPKGGRRKRRVKPNRGSRLNAVQRRSEGAEAVGFGLLMAAVVAPFAFAFTFSGGQATSVGAVLADAVSATSGATSSGPGALVWLVVWIFAVGAALLPTLPPGSTGSRFIGQAAAWAAAGAIAYTFYQSGRVAATARIQTTDVPAAVAFSLGHFTTLVVFLVLVVVGAGIAFALAQPEFHAQTDGAGWRSILAASPVIVIAVLVVIWANLNPIRADTLVNQGVAASASGANELALSLMAQATDSAPSEPRYYFLQANVARVGAAALDDAGERDALLDIVAEALSRARELAPLDADHYANTARYLVVRGATFEDGPNRFELFTQASDAYTDARTLRPNSPRLLREHASLLVTMGLAAEAEELETRAAALEVTP